jgi:uncharacterized membrane protein
MTSLRSVMTALLLVYVLIAPVAAMDVVLCIGADGHVAFEAAHNGRCGTAVVLQSATMRSQAAVTLARADHCGPCVDVPVLTGDTRQQPLPALHSPIQSAVPAFVLVTDISPVSPEVATTPPLRALFPITSSTLRALRTVVLLRLRLQHGPSWGLSQHRV